MHSLKDLQDEQLIPILKSAYLSLEHDASIRAQMKEGDKFSIIIMQPSVIAFTVSFSENILSWKIGTDAECATITWKEKKHYLEWLEGKRGILKLVMLKKFKLQGKVPVWANGCYQQLRKYVAENVLNS